jgi:peptidoglycan hydrolase-like amidase
MSQNAAKVMADQGYTCREVLDFFYEGITIGNIATPYS